MLWAKCCIGGNHGNAASSINIFFSKKVNYPDAGRKRSLLIFLTFTQETKITNSLEAQNEVYGGVDEIKSLPTNFAICFSFALKICLFT